MDPRGQPCFQKKDRAAFRKELADLLPKSGVNIKTSQKMVIKGDGNVGVQSSGDDNSIHVSR